MTLRNKVSVGLDIVFAVVLGFLILNGEWLAAGLFLIALVMSIVMAILRYHKPTTENTLWLIWSNEHRGWWKPRSSGYTNDRDDAGVYTYEEALEIVEGANKYLDRKKPPYEAMVKCKD